MAKKTLKKEIEGIMEVATAKSEMCMAKVKTEQGTLFSCTFPNKEGERSRLSKMAVWVVRRESSRPERSMLIQECLAFISAHREYIPEIIGKYKRYRNKGENVGTNPEWSFETKGRIFDMSDMISVADLIPKAWLAQAGVTL